MTSETKNTIEHRTARGNQSAFYTKHWGLADQRLVLADGIVQYWTPSHGGFELSQRRLRQMRAEYRAASFTSDNCFEEDCSWCAVALQWPHLFSDKHVIAAQNTFNQFYTNKAEA